MPDFSVFCKSPPVHQCHACGSAVPEDDEQCPDCGYYLASYDLGEDPDDEENVDEDVDISEAIEQLELSDLLSSNDLADLLRRALPNSTPVYGWWDSDGRNNCVAWCGPRGWFATITRVGADRDGTWGDGTRAIARAALRRMVGPFSSVRALALSVRYDEYGKLGGYPPAESGAVLWGLLRLLDEEDKRAVHAGVKIRSRYVTARRHSLRLGSTELP
jgi:hypothetical protein